MSIWTCGVLLFAMVGDGVTSEFIPSGVTQRTGGYRPIQAKLTDASESLKKAPEGLEAPMFGMLNFGEKSFIVVLDEPEEKEAKLFVDTNGDGDLTNDPATEWEARKQGERTMYNGSAKVDLGENEIAQVNLYRFDPKDPARAQLKSTILYYADFGYEFTLTLDGSEFKTSVAGSVSEDASLWIDRDQNKRPSRRFEMAKIGEPFNFTGTTFVLSVKNGTLALDKASEALPKMDMPPDLSIGKPALKFTAKMMDGNEVEFPKSYAGKLVMLDFWATWCGPCIGEIPHMKEAYTEWHEKGFEILGVSFDMEGMEDKVKDFLVEKELPWSQIYEGKGWDTTLGNQHDVSGIPFVLLVDGDTGEILATAKELRGKGLSEFIGKTLEERKKGTAAQN